MADEQNQGTTQSSQGAQDQSSSSAAGGTAANTQGSTASQTTSTQTGQTQQQATAPSRPDWLPEKFFDPVKGPNLDEFGKHFSEIATRDAAEQSRRLTLPQKPEDVKLELPKDFKLPQDVEFKLDPAKPEFAKMQAVAIKHGLTQDAVTELLGVYAETVVGSESSVQAWKQAEIAKLGANGTARVTALQTFFTGLIGAEKAAHLQTMLATAGGVEALESVTAKFSSQGAASFSQAHREPGNANGRLAAEEHSKLSPAAKLDYARQFDQSQFQKSA